MNEMDTERDDETVTLREALEDMVYQFGYDCVKNGQPAVCNGGLSALEGAFDALGWDNPYIIPDPVWCDAPVEPRCPNRTTCGTPSKDGYKRFCHKHFDLWKAAADSVAPCSTEPQTPNTETKS